MNPFNIICKYYTAGTALYDILLTHSRSVAEKAVAIAMNHPEMHPDLDFIREAAMLHDVGIFLTHAPGIACFGDRPYICHGYLGRDLLQKEGFPRHALVCERHTGMGLALDVIVEKRLPLPHRDMLPVSIEEQMICFADKFFSKTQPDREKNIDQILLELSVYEREQTERFKECCKRFLG
jgi:uncharacterized protein